MPNQPRKSCSINKIENPSVTLCFFWFAHSDYVQATKTEHGGERDKKGKVKERGEGTEKDGTGVFETSDPNDQYLTNS